MMAIKEVKEIPANVSKALKESDRDMVLRDFNEALDNHVEIFEFDGDYNYKTLSQKAKEVGIGCSHVVMQISNIMENNPSEVMGFKADLSKYFDSVPIEYIPG